MRVDDPASFVAAFERLRRILGCDRRAPGARRRPRPLRSIESFVPGQEFAVEGLLHDGVFRALAIFDKPDPLDGPVLRGDDLRDAVAGGDGDSAPHHRDGGTRGRGAWASTRTGPRRVPGHCCSTPSGPAAGANRPPEVYVLEVAGRPIGGLCSRVLRFIGSSGASGLAGGVAPAPCNRRRCLGIRPRAGRRRA